MNVFSFQNGVWLNNKKIIFDFFKKNEFPRFRSVFASDFLFLIKLYFFYIKKSRFLLFLFGCKYRISYVPPKAYFLIPILCLCSHIKLKNEKYQKNLKKLKI